MRTPEELVGLIAVHKIKKKDVAESVGLSRDTVARALNHGYESGVTMTNYKLMHDEILRRVEVAKAARAARFPAATAPAQEAQK